MLRNKALLERLATVHHRELYTYLPVDEQVHFAGVSHTIYAVRPFFILLRFALSPAVCGKSVGIHPESKAEIQYPDAARVRYLAKDPQRLAGALRLPLQMDLKSRAEQLNQSVTVIQANLRADITEHFFVFICRKGFADFFPDSPEITGLVAAITRGLFNKGFTFLLEIMSDDNDCKYESYKTCAYLCCLGIPINRRSYAHDPRLYGVPDTYPMTPLEASIRRCQKNNAREGSVVYMLLLLLNAKADASLSPEGSNIFEWIRSSAKVIWGRRTFHPKTSRESMIGSLRRHEAYGAELPSYQPRIGGFSAEEFNSEFMKQLIRSERDEKYSKPRSWHPHTIEILGKSKIFKHALCDAVLKDADAIAKAQTAEAAIAFRDRMLNPQVSVSAAIFAVPRHRSTDLNSGCLGKLGVWRASSRMGDAKAALFGASSSSSSGASAFVKVVSSSLASTPTKVTSAASS